MNEWKTHSGNGSISAIRLRAANLSNPDDLENAMEMEVALMRELSRRRKKLNNAYADFNEQALGEQIASELDLNERRLRFIFAMIDGKEKGCARYHFNCDGRGNCLNLDTLYVHPAVRGMGVGTRVLEAIKGEARYRGVGRMQLHADFHVVPYYKMHGFRSEGEPKSSDVNQTMFLEL